LTIIIVVVETSLMVALNGLVAGFGNFAERTGKRESLIIILLIRDEV